MTSQAASMGVRAVGERPFPDRPEDTNTLPQIDHILVLMMENHTYDNWVGMLGRGPGQQPRGDGFTIGPNGQPTAANPPPQTVRLSTPSICRPPTSHRASRPRNGHNPMSSSTAAATTGS